MKVVSFFSGCGGLDLGFEQASVDECDGLSCAARALSCICNRYKKCIVG